MNDNEKRARRQFFIATYYGDEKSYVSSEHVVSINPLPNHPHHTELRTDGGGAYSHTPLIRASFDRVKELFAEHGYEFVDIDEVPKAPAEENADGNKASKNLLKRLIP